MTAPRPRPRCPTGAPDARPAAVRCGRAEPLIVGHDQDAWARELDCHAHPPDVALAPEDAVRADTVPLPRRPPDQAWERHGRHTESGRYGAEDWLRIHAERPEIHGRQIGETVVAWRSRGGAGPRRS